MDDSDLTTKNRTRCLIINILTRMLRYTNKGGGEGRPTHLQTLHYLEHDDGKGGREILKSHPALLAI